VRAERGREGKRGERERGRRGKGRDGGRRQGRPPKLKLGPTRTIFLAPALLVSVVQSCFVFPGLYSLHAVSVTGQCCLSVVVRSAAVAREYKTGRTAKTAEQALKRRATWCTLNLIGRLATIQFTPP